MSNEIRNAVAVAKDEHYSLGKKIIDLEKELESMRKRRALLGEFLNYGEELIADGNEEPPVQKTEVIELKSVELMAHTNIDFSPKETKRTKPKKRNHDGKNQIDPSVKEFVMKLIEDNVVVVQILKMAREKFGQKCISNYTVYIWKKKFVQRGRETKKKQIQEELKPSHDLVMPERLKEKSKEIQSFVRDCLLQRKSITDIHREIEQKFGEKMPYGVVDTWAYRLRKGGVLPKKELSK